MHSYELKHYMSISEGGTYLSIASSPSKSTEIELMALLCSLADLTTCPEKLMICKNPFSVPSTMWSVSRFAAVTFSFLKMSCNAPCITMQERENPHDYSSKAKKTHRSTSHLNSLVLQYIIHDTVIRFECRSATDLQLQIGSTEPILCNNY